MDITTPRNVQLSGFFLRSNALMNARERIPNCLTVIIDALTARKFDVQLEYGEEAANELDEVIAKIQALKTEVLDDVPFRKLMSSGPDVKFYNDYLEKMTCCDCRPTMLQTVRVYAECYVYRRVWECFELTNQLIDFDPYESVKQQLFRTSLPIIEKLAKYLKNLHKYPCEDDKDDFEKLIKLNLWANHCDIIMSKEYVERNLREMLSIIKKDPFIVCNQTEKAWNIISERDHPSNIVAFICDNAGVDFFLELCVADFLYTNHYARIIHFHVKHIPWFISDLMEKDIHQMLNKLVDTQDKYLSDFARNWQDNFKSGRWKIITRKFWTLPIGFSRMQEIDPVLYKMLEATKMVIIKGDLNYRKLLEDKNFAPSTPAAIALKDFHPSNLLLIRVMKCDVVCDIPTFEVEKFEKLNENWMDCGSYGLIQFVSKPSDVCDCVGIGK